MCVGPLLLLKNIADGHKLVGYFSQTNAVNDTTGISLACGLSDST